MSEEFFCCPVCSTQVLSSELDRHVEGHFNSAVLPCSGENVLDKPCSFSSCPALVPLQEWDDHMLAHEFQSASSEFSASPPSEGHGRASVDRASVLNAHLVPVPLETSNSGCCAALNDSLIAAEMESLERLEFDQVAHDSELALHIHKAEEKLQESTQFKQLQEEFGMSEGGSYVKQFDARTSKSFRERNNNIEGFFSRKADVIREALSGADSGKSCTQGIMAALKAFCMSTRSPAKSYYLCSETDHYSCTSADAGWGCGYRNSQMMISSLLRESTLKNRLIESFGCARVPSIPRLQEAIEAAWRNGYDVPGGEQLGFKLSSTRKWIGSTEVAALLRSMRIRAKVVDFHKATGPGDTHQLLFDWVLDYFRRTSLDKTSAFPLFLQHQGHSRLCIGVEELLVGERSLNLLLFDPSHTPSQMKTLLDCYHPRMVGLIRRLRRSAKQMRAKQYQIVYLDGVFDSDAEIEASKTIHPIRIP